MQFAVISSGKISMSYQPIPIPSLHHTEFRWSIREVTSAWDRRRFFRYPGHLYRNDRYWVPPLFGSGYDRQLLAHPPAYLDVGLFAAEAVNLTGSDPVVGRVAALIDRRFNSARHEQVGFFALFEVNNHEEMAAELLEAVEVWVSQRVSGAVTLRGPVGLDPLGGCGVLVDGFNARPLVFMSYNLPYYGDLFAANGYEVSGELHAYRPEPGAPAASGLSDPDPDGGAWRGWVLRRADPGRLPEEVLRLIDMAGRLTENRPAFAALAGVRLEDFAARLARYVDPALLFFLDAEGQSVGYGLALPDLNTPRYAARRWPFPLNRLRARLAGPGGRARIFRPVLLPGHEDPQLAAALLCAVERAAAGLGYRHFEYACIPSDDALMLPLLRARHAAPVRTYRVYEKNL